MAERATLAAAPRTVLGKQVRQLRREGILPANVFGRGLDSVAIQLDQRDFLRNVKTAGVRSMFELRVDGEGGPRYVIIRGMTRQGGMGAPTHVDFYQVDLKRPIQTNVNVRLVGEAPAVRDLAGTLVQSIETVSVRCLPLSIPEAIDLDVSHINRFEITVTVGDLVAPEGVEILTDPSINVVTVNPPRIRGMSAAQVAAQAYGEEGGAEGEEEAEA